MKMVMKLKIEVGAPPKHMQVADMLAWFAATLMSSQDENAPLLPASGPIKFGSETVGEYSVCVVPLQTGGSSIHYFPQSRVF